MNQNQNEHKPAPATTAEPTAATEPAPQIAENRDLAAAAPEPTATEPTTPEPTTRSTRQFDMGNGRRLIDMRPTDGGVEIIPEAPGVNFDGLPKMTEREAILAALDCDGKSDAERLELVREIVAAH